MGFWGWLNGYEEEDKKVVEREEEGWQGKPLMSFMSFFYNGVSPSTHSGQWMDRVPNSLIFCLSNRFYFMFFSSFYFFSFLIHGMADPKIREIL